MKINILIITVVLCISRVFAQTDSTSFKSPNITRKDPRSAVIDSSKQRDIVDIINLIRHKTSSLEARKQARRLNFSLVPSIGYTLSTGFALDISGNVAFYTGKSHSENLSSIESDLAYDTKSQRIFITRSEIWAPANAFKFVSDIRWEKFPTETYGLGSLTGNAKLNNIDYNFFRFYGTFYKPLNNDFYVGAGYNLDYHYNTVLGTNQDKSVPDFQKYGFLPASTSSGINIDILYDSRRNALNPLGGAYANLIVTQNLIFLGSNNNWRVYQLDIRKYVRLSPNSNNVLAFWSLDWLTTGHAPYLDLPANGEDMYSNTGRGYAQARFRGKDMLYLESEYRFGISRNGLIGGVVFTNCETFAGYPAVAFQKLIPAAGTGIRIKINKHSNTNACIDYGVGTNGSHGFFVNLGEVF